MGIEIRRAMPAEIKTDEDACCVEVTDDMHGRELFDVAVTTHVLAAHMILEDEVTTSDTSVLKCPKAGCETTRELSVSCGRYKVSPKAVCLQAAAQQWRSRRLTAYGM